MRAGHFFCGNAKHVLKYFADTDLIAGIEPFLDPLLPRVDLEARLLFGSRQSFKLGRLQPPRCVGLVSNDRLSPELIPITLDAGDINAVAGDRPEAARAGRVPSSSHRQED